MILFSESRCFVKFFPFPKSRSYGVIFLNPVSGIKFMYGIDNRAVQLSVKQVARYAAVFSGCVFHAFLYTLCN